jgi:hypothetical protein
MDKTLDRIKKLNPDLNIYSINDPIFKAYGKVLNACDFSQYTDYLEQHTIIPKLENTYIANDEDLFQVTKNIHAIHDTFGDVEVQMGYVNGNNNKLNALEYHKSSEINIAVTPLVLLLALQSDICNNQLETKKVKAFYLPPSAVIEIHPKTLHFSPCKVSDGGFKCGVVLPLGTNTKFVKAKNDNDSENDLLFKTNKWLIAHEEHKKMIALGAFVGLIGKNIEIKY